MSLPSHGNCYLFALRLLVSCKFIHGSINRYVEKFLVEQIDEKVKKIKIRNDKRNHVTIQFAKWRSREC